ncbi:hypothetical protein ABZ502_17140 [Streptomyces abikoensis]|uniref:hypothetical protein n=1 Tax=Streptomyces abikoensis TaxID=97398 RepID=UPI0033CBE78C
MRESQRVDAARLPQEPGQADCPASLSEVAVRALQLSGPVQTFLRQHAGQWVDAGDIGQAIGIDMVRDAGPLASCLDMLTEIDLAESDGSSCWRFPAEAREASARTAALGPFHPGGPAPGGYLPGPATHPSLIESIRQAAPFMASRETQHKARGLVKPLLAVLRNRPGQALAFTDILPLVGCGPKDTTALGIAMSYLVDAGKAVQVPVVDGGGTRWSAA